MHISQFQYKDLTVDLTHHKGRLAWAFEYDGQPYGAALEVKSKKVLDIASISAQLILNAIATYEDLKK